MMQQLATTLVEMGITSQRVISAKQQVQVMMSYLTFQQTTLRILTPVPVEKFSGITQHGRLWYNKGVAALRFQMATLTLLVGLPVPQP